MDDAERVRNLNAYTLKALGEFELFNKYCRLKLCSLLHFSAIVIWLLLFANYKRDVNAIAVGIAYWQQCHLLTGNFESLMFINEARNWMLLRMSLENIVTDQHY